MVAVHILTRLFLTFSRMYCCYIFVVYILCWWLCSSGHGGSHAAEYLKEHLFDNLMNHPKFMEDTIFAIRTSFTWYYFVGFGLDFILVVNQLQLFIFSWQIAGETYKRTDTDFLEAEINAQRDDGSTASTAILIGNHLYIANVGDSRAVISKAGEGLFIYR